MSELLDLVLRAHGGIDRWRILKQVTASFVSGGGLMSMKGINVPPTPLERTATIRHESTMISAMRKPDQRTRFTAERVVVESFLALYKNAAALKVAIDLNDNVKGSVKTRVEESADVGRESQ
jgi:hypothetical protein